MAASVTDGKSTQRQFKTMDARGFGPSAPNGSGLRPFEMVLEKGVAVGCVSDRSTGNCPYGLGADCPIVEIAEGRALVHWKQRLMIEAAFVSAGCAISALAVFIV